MHPLEVSRIMTALGTPTNERELRRMILAGDADGEVPEGVPMSEVVASCSGAPGSGGVICVKTKESEPRDFLHQ